MLNDRQLKNAKPAPSQYDLTDSGGLSARVHPSGKISFMIRYRLDGRQYRKKIGNYPAISLKEARQKSTEYQSMIDQGINPVDAERFRREEKANEPTVAEFAQEFNTRYLQKKLKSPSQPLRNLTYDVLPYIGNRKISTVTRRDLVFLLDKIVDRGSPVQANRTLSAIKKMFAYAVERGVIEDPSLNPALVITKSSAGGHEENRKRFLTLTEIRIVWLKLNDWMVDPIVKSVIRLMILTGVRVGEAVKARRDEIDWKKEIWTIPGRHTKNRQPLKIPLTDLMIAEIKGLERIAGNSPYLCQSPVSELHKPASTDLTSRAVARSRDYFGIPVWTPHDLRRTLSTHMNEISEPWIVEKILNHKLQGVMGVYNQAEYLDKRRDALTLWTEKIKQITAPDNVIQIKKA
ncbi:integrase arm-type DNA-binding domain-containing protein [bacterium]|nr:integrase arm-type DNA-binding domain-containing protein [bacterium]